MPLSHSLLIKSCEAMGEPESIQQQLLARAQYDWLGLWVIIRKMKEVRPVSPPEGVQKMTLQVVRELLEAGWVKAGNPTFFIEAASPQPGAPGGRNIRFIPWPCTPEETLKRIESEWNRLGTEPSLGEIVWFEITEKGESVLKKSG